MTDNEKMDSSTDDQETTGIPGEQSAEPPTEGVADSALKEIMRKAEEYDALLAQYQRAAADFSNSQKRLERQMEERIAYANEKFALELLPISDNLGRAVQSALEHHRNSAIIAGIELVQKQLLSVFKNHGIEAIDTKIGDAFDSKIHDALAVVPTAEMEPNRIIEVHQRGYLMHGRLLRAAHVIVSARPVDE